MTTTESIENLIPLTMTLSVAERAMRMNKIRSFKRKYKRRKFL